MHADSSILTLSILTFIVSLAGWGDRCINQAKYLAKDWASAQSEWPPESQSFFSLRT
jgi:hypothetical protein